MIGAANNSDSIRHPNDKWIRLAIGCALLFVVLVGGCVAAPERSEGLQRFEYEQAQMGVPFRIIVYAGSEVVAEGAARAAFARVAELNSIMSDYETDSELSRLSRSSEEGAPEVRVSEDLWTVLALSQRLARETDGAFDITIGPCAALWRRARREERFPDAERLENAREKVGYKNLVLNESKQTARLLKYGMRLDLGGIAKGYAADEALKVLRSHGITRALVAASGDVALGDPPPGEKGWRVEIIGYDETGGPPSEIAILANCGVSTSGDSSQRLEVKGVRYSHILNPATCVGMTNHALATVIAKNCTMSDSLETPLTILEPAEGLRLVARYEAAARIVQLEGDAPVVKQNDRFTKRTANKSDGERSNIRIQR